MRSVNNMKIQVTLFHNEGKYRPVATTIEVDSMEDFKANQSAYVKKAITKIAFQRYKTPNALYAEGYTKYKFRPYKSEDKKQAFVEDFFKNREKKS